MNLEVQSGSIVGLLGPNGAGKTTLIRMLAGLARPSAGSAEVLGAVVPSELRRVQDKLGVLLERPAFIPTLSGRDNLRVLPRTAVLAQDRLEELLGSFGLSSVARSQVRTYSQGMRQRLALVATLWRNPDVLILDEPTTALDAMGIRMLRERLIGLRGNGKTILLASHLISEIERICDFVIIMHNGKLVAQGSPTSLAQARFVEMVARDPAKAVSLLNERGWHVSGYADRPEVLVVAHGSLDDVVDTMRAAGLEVTQIVVKQSASLEDTLFRLTSSS